MADPVAEVGITHEDGVAGVDIAVVHARPLQFEHRVGEGALLLGGEFGLILSDGHRVSPLRSERNEGCTLEIADGRAGGRDGVGQPESGGCADGDAQGITASDLLHGLKCHQKPANG
ncbi:hypothetical protein ACFCZ1_04555 [Streptomyces sp. NPDC056224]|uniref:hypothetical protein n=1 Tax=Streptomyces sp. NPDC056224 TaxID=3345750 RepID=UPI0035DCEA2D